MRISTAMGIVLCSGLAYTACGSDDGDKNPLAADVNNAETSDALIRLADKAMYEVKHSGKRGYRLSAPH